MGDLRFLSACQRRLIAAATSLVLALTMLLAAPASSAAVLLADVSTAAVDLVYAGNSVTVKAKKPLWGKSVSLSRVAPDQTLTLIRKFTPTEQSPDITIRDLNTADAYRLDSPGMPKPLTFRLTIQSTTSTSKADTTPQPPSGKVALATVGAGGKNSEWYLSPYFFSTLGQTFKVQKPTTVTKAAWHFSPAVTTLLTPEGVKLLENPETIDWSDPKTQGIEIFNDDPKYSFKTKATFTLYSGVKNGLASNLDTDSLTPVTQVAREVAISHNGYLTFNLGSLNLPPGNYFATITLADVPRDVLTVFLDGRNFGGPQSKKDAYPQGQAYRVSDGSSTKFQPHDAKRQPVSSSGRDTFDPGDLELILIGK